MPAVACAAVQLLSALQRALQLAMKRNSASKGSGRGSHGARAGYQLVHSVSACLSGNDSLQSQALLASTPVEAKQPQA